MGRGAFVVSPDARAAPRAGRRLRMAARGGRVARVVAGHFAERGGYWREFADGGEVWKQEQLARAVAQRSVHSRLGVRKDLRGASAPSRCELHRTVRSFPPGSPAQCDWRRFRPRWRNVFRDGRTANAGGSVSCEVPTCCQFATGGWEGRGTAGYKPAARFPESSGPDSWRPLVSIE